MMAPVGYLFVAAGGLLAGGGVVQLIAAGSPRTAAICATVWLVGTILAGLGLSMVRTPGGASGPRPEKALGKTDSRLRSR